MSDHVIVWDLETVPDIVGYAAANGLTGKSDEEIRESLSNKFPKHIYHSIICIVRSSLIKNLTVGQSTRSVRLTSAKEPRSS